MDLLKASVSRAVSAKHITQEVCSEKRHSYKFVERLSKIHYIDLFECKICGKQELK